MFGHECKLLFQKRWKNYIQIRTMYLPSQNRWKYFAFQIFFSSQNVHHLFSFSIVAICFIQKCWHFFAERSQKKHTCIFIGLKKIDDFQLIVQHKNSFPIHIYKMTGHLLREQFACESKKQWQKKRNGLNTNNFLIWIESGFSAFFPFSFVCSFISISISIVIYRSAQI